MELSTLDLVFVSSNGMSERGVLSEDRAILIVWSTVDNFKTIST